jgi:hypothetical protein
MINKIKVVEKGYTITVVSWENDGDYYQTNTMTVQTEEEARKIAKLCNELFISCVNGEGGIGNTCDDEDEEANETIDNYIENNPELGLTRDEIIELDYELCGSSECYIYRVCESVTVTYSPEDIYLEKTI